MTTRYVGPGGNDANSGLSWALRKLTLNGLEDSPVQAGDICYIAPGTYRETLTCDVSGSSGSPITYIGDYSGGNTDGVGGIVRITGSDNDQTATRNNCIVAATKNYRTFHGILLNTTAQQLIILTDCTYINVDQCAMMIDYLPSYPLIGVYGASQLGVTISRCFLTGQTGYGLIRLDHSSAVSNSGHVVENCIFATQNAVALRLAAVGGSVLRNSLVFTASAGVFQTGLAAGQLTTINNCVLYMCSTGFSSDNSATIAENYNNLIACITPRSNTNTGANSNTYAGLFDARWFFEAVNGGRILTPFDLASYSQLVNVAGTSPTTTDLRGTAVQGAQREWGALEYDSTLLIKSAAGGGGPWVYPWRGNL